MRAAPTLDGRRSGPKGRKGLPCPSPLPSHLRRETDEARERGRETRQGNSAIAGSLLRKDPLSPRETLLPHSVSEQPGATDEGSYHSLLPLRDTHGLPEESLSVPSGSTSWDQWKPQGH